MQPTATNLSQALDFTEDQGPIALDDIIVSDADPGDVITATLTLQQPAAGTLTSEGGGTYDTTTGVWSVTGSVDEVNAALAAVELIVAPDWEESFTVTTRIRDADGTGPADGLITLSGSGVNDAPVATAPDSISVSRNVTTEITGLSFLDVDAEPEPVTVTLAAPQGTLQAVSGGGVTVGGTPGSLTLTGAIADINSYIAAGEVTYTPEADATGDVNLTVTIDDGGANGSGGPQTDTEVVVLEVRSPNSAPTLDASGSPVLAARNEDAGPPVNGSTAGGTTVSSLLGGANDVDDDPVGVAIQGVSADGVLWFSLDGGAVWTQAPAVSASAPLLLDGAALIYFQPDPNFNGAVSGAISYRAWDQTDGVSGATYALSSTAGSTPFSSTLETASVDIAAVNDAPQITAPASLSLVAGGWVELSGIGFSDVDGLVGIVTATLSVTSGELDKSLTTGVLVTETATSMTMTGPAYLVATYLGMVTYTASNPGDGVLTITVDDHGNVGAGGSLQATREVVLHVAPVGKPPPPPPEPKVVDGVEVWVRDTVAPDGNVVREMQILAAEREGLSELHLDDAERILAFLPDHLALNVKTLAKPPAAANLLPALQIGLGQTDEIATSKAFADKVQRLAEPAPNSASLIFSVVLAAMELQQANSPLVLQGKVRNADEGPNVVTIDARLADLPSDIEIELQNMDLAIIRGAATLTGGSGNQTVFGDAAPQRMVLGAGDDELYGGGGDDVVGSESGADTLSGDAGRDTVFGGEGEDQLWGGTGADHLHGNLGADYAHGGVGADTLHGGQGDDAVRGGQDGDIAFGDMGDDTLFGDLGDDTLTGGVGDDVLTGGLGADLFVASAGADRILDFNAAEGDRLRLEAGLDPVLRQDGADLVVEFGAAGRVVLQGVQLGTLPGGWILLA